MPLDGDQINQLIIDATMGRPEPSIPGDEAREFFERVKQDVEKAKRAGTIVDLPNH